MEFTYSAYIGLLRLLNDEKYTITNYHDYNTYSDNEDIVILRHDIDNSIEKAYELASFENELGVKSTYFVLMTSDFYNVASKRNIDMLKKMNAMGHEIGLHFDEACYEGMGIEGLIAMAEKEREVLIQWLDFPVNTISMHRPSKLMLEKDIQFETMVNSYSSVFFKDFKYVSDSRMHWRENVEEIIRSHKYHRLHILTHAFWYDETKDLGTRDKIMKFIACANEERYNTYKDNFRDLDEFVTRKDVVK